MGPSRLVVSHEMIIGFVRGVAKVDSDPMMAGWGHLLFGRDGISPSE